MQPGAGVGPVALRGAQRDTQCGGRLAAGHAGEVAQVDDLGGQRVGLLEPVECLVESEPVVRGRLGDVERRCQIDALAVAAVPDAPLAPCLLDEDAAHGEPRRREEMAAAVPRLLALRADQAQVRLMDQCGCFQCLAGPLRRQPCRGELAQLIVDQRQKLPCGRGIARLDGTEDARDFANAAASGRKK
jgi:hypothetical protein